MKKIILLSLFLNSFTFGYSQISVMEGFEQISSETFLPEGWQSTGETMFYATEFVPPCNDIKSARANIYNSQYQDKTNAILQSPTYQANGSALEFKFNYKAIKGQELSAIPAGDFYLLLQYTIDNGNNWITKYTINAENHIPSTNCTTIEQTFTSEEIPVGNVKFRFYAQLLNMSSDVEIIIDNVEITQNLSTPSHTNSLKSLKIYPNPVSEVAYLSNDENIEKIEIFDLNGRKIYNQKVENTTIEIKTHHLAPGIYLVKAMSQGKWGIRTIIKK